MGMAASQARLIALTARMSDCEYEAQQINQQRLTLSNQMNAVYESLINMDVPTPPSKLDPQFMTTVYRGNMGGNSITLKPGSNGKMAAFRTVKNANIVANVGGQTVGNVQDPESFISNKPVQVADFKTWDYKNLTQIIQPKEGESGPKEGCTEYVTGSYTVQKLDESGNPLVDETTGEPVTETVNFLEPIAAKDVKPNGTTIPEGKILSSSTTTAYYTKEINNASQMDPDGVYTSPDFEGTKTTKTGEEIINHNGDAQNLADKSYVVKKSDGSFELLDVEKLKKGEIVSQATGEVVEGEIFECTNPSQFTVSKEAKKNGLNENDVTVGGNPLVSLASAITKYSGESAFEEAYSGLKNTFSDLSEADLKEKFSCIICSDSKGNLSFSFCMTSDINNGDDRVSVYEPGKGSYDEEIEGFDPSTITYDTNGNVKSAVVDEQTVTMSLETVLNELHYEEAMNQYNSDKAVYDSEQNKLNQQTSIYQRQDKMLELKLTRIENERNALKTEIDAVKKVAQENIEGSYKTFSG